MLVLLLVKCIVTPFVGVWIETLIWRGAAVSTHIVTPFVGVWIETAPSPRNHKGLKSHPSWVCGLKLHLFDKVVYATAVTPFVGVWIETLLDAP